MSSDLESLAAAIRQIGSSSDPLGTGFQQAAGRGRALAAIVPSSRDAATVVGPLQQAGKSSLAAAQAVTAFSAGAARFADRLAGSSGSGTRGGGDTSGSLLGDADRAAFTDYTGSGYQQINPALRSGEPLSDDVRRRSDDLSAALAKLPNSDAGVFRGATLTPTQLARYMEGQQVTEAGFTSTTRDPSATFRGNVEFLIASKRGKDVSAHSLLPGEAEVLFDKGSTFYVDSNKFDPNTGMTAIVLIEV